MANKLLGLGGFVMIYIYVYTYVLYQQKVIK